MAFPHMLNLRSMGSSLVADRMVWKLLGTVWIAVQHGCSLWRGAEWAVWKEEQALRSRAALQATGRNFW